MEGMKKRQKRTSGKTKKNHQPAKICGFRRSKYVPSLLPSNELELGIFLWHSHTPCRQTSCIPTKVQRTNACTINKNSAFDNFDGDEKSIRMWQSFCPLYILLARHSANVFGMDTYPMPSPFFIRSSFVRSWALNRDVMVILTYQNYFYEHLNF